MSTVRPNKGPKISGSKKKRKPALSSLLSFFSLGMGQIYNGELFKGLSLKAALFLSISLYMLLNLKTAIGLFYFTILILVFVALKIYSITQAFNKSRTLGSDYALKKFNKVYFYVVLFFVSAALNLSPLITLPSWLLIENNSFHPFRSPRSKNEYLELYDSRAESWPVESKTKRIDTSYGQTFVRICGLENARSLVLLHGAGTASLMWIPNIEPLADSFKIYAVDNIYDFGRSVFTRRMKDPEDMVQWLDEVFDGLELRNNIHLMGMSYGGWVASQYALSHQDRLDRIVLLAPAATVADFSWGFIKGGIRLWLWPYWSSYKKMMAWAIGDMGGSSEEARQWIKTGAGFEFIAMRSFKPKMLVRPTVLTDKDWRSLKIPVLFMVGDQEVIYSVSAEEAVRYLKNTAPHIETELVLNAGHGFTSLQADFVNQKVLDFLVRD